MYIENETKNEQKKKIKIKGKLFPLHAVYALSFNLNKIITHINKQANKQTNQMET